MDDCTKNIFGLKDPRLTWDPAHPEHFSVEESKHGAMRRTTYYSYLDFNERPHCPECERPMVKTGCERVHNKLACTVNSMSFLELRKQRYRCNHQDCPYTGTCMPTFVDTQWGHQICNTLRAAIMTETCENQSHKTIAMRNGVSEHTVQRFAERYEATYANNHKWLPTCLLFDDLNIGHALSRSGMGIQLSDGSNHHVFDILPERGGRALETAFLKYPRWVRERVQIICVDLYKPYREIIRRCFPNATVVADHFHVVAQMYRTLNQYRVSVMKQYPKGSDEYRWLKNHWRKLLKDRSKLDYQQYRGNWKSFHRKQMCEQDVVDSLLAIDDDLRYAYDVYQYLLHVLKFAREDELDAALDTNRPMPTIMRAELRKLRVYEAEIRAGFRHPGISNGPTEGNNNHIKTIKKTAYGFRNFFHFRLRVLCQLGYTQRQKARKRPSTTFTKCVGIAA
jgi:transposase